jgi:hypothetical protein
MQERDRLINTEEKTISQLTPGIRIMAAGIPDNLITQNDGYFSIRKIKNAAIKELKKCFKCIISTKTKPADEQVKIKLNYNIIDLIIDFLDFDELTTKFYLEINKLEQLAGQTTGEIDQIMSDSQ